MRGAKTIRDVCGHMDTGRPPLSVERDSRIQLVVRANQPWEDTITLSFSLLERQEAWWSFDSQHKHMYGLLREFGWTELSNTSRQIQANLEHTVCVLFGRTTASSMLLLTLTLQEKLFSVQFLFKLTLSIAVSKESISLHNHVLTHTNLLAGLLAETFKCLTAHYLF